MARLPVGPPFGFLRGRPAAVPPAGADRAGRPNGRFMAVPPRVTRPGGARRAAFVTGLTAAFLALGCAGEEAAPQARAGWPAEAAAAVDSGNAAYRAGDYEAARRHFRAAARVAPGVGTAWFGVYMAERALGNDAAADSALRRVGDLGEAARIHHGVAGEDEPETRGAPETAPSPRHLEGGS